MPQLLSTLRLSGHHTVMKSALDRGEVAARACETDGWGCSKRGGLETTQLRPEPRTPGVERLGLSYSGSRKCRLVLDAEPGGCAVMDVGEGEGKRLGRPGMRGTRSTGTLGRQALSDRLALKPYWGKPTVRNFRGGDGDVGIIEARSAPSLYPTTSSNHRGWSRFNSQLRLAHPRSSNRQGRVGS